MQKKENFLRRGTELCCVCVSTAYINTDGWGTKYRNEWMMKGNVHAFGARRVEEEVRERTPNGGSNDSLLAVVDGEKKLIPEWRSRQHKPMFKWAHENSCTSSCDWLEWIVRGLARLLSFSVFFGREWLLLDIFSYRIAHCARLWPMSSMPVSWFDSISKIVVVIRKYM